MLNEYEVSASSQLNGLLFANQTEFYEFGPTMIIDALSRGR